MEVILLSARRNEKGYPKSCLKKKKRKKRRRSFVGLKSD